MNEDTRTQWLAIFLIVFASACIAASEWKDWQNLNNFALTFGGAGVGILTGNKLRGGSTTVNTNERGTTNVIPPTEPSPDPKPAPNKI